MKTEKQINHYLNQVKTEYKKQNERRSSEIDWFRYGEPIMKVEIETLEWILEDLGLPLKITVKNIIDHASRL